MHNHAFMLSLAFAEAYSMTSKTLMLILNVTEKL